MAPSAEGDEEEVISRGGPWSDGTRMTKRGSIMRESLKAANLKPCALRLSPFVEPYSRPAT